VFLEVIALVVQVTKTLVGFFCFGLVLGCLAVDEARAKAVSREEAYALVENLIREGTYGWYQVHPPETAGGKEQLKLYRSPLTDTPFDPSAVYHRVKRTGLSALDTYAVGLDDQRGFHGAGWTLSGGLVDIVFLDGRSLELFGIHVQRWHAGLFDNYFRYKEIIYEFYLVARDEKTKQGRIVKRWTIPNDAIDFFTPKGSYGFRVDEVAGYLSYDPTAGVAEVRVTGLRREFRERVPVK
jgi:hypothetical protein